ncbi:MAG: sugar transferase [Candidatus Binatia bacterium]
MKRIVDVLAATLGLVLLLPLLLLVALLIKLDSVGPVLFCQERIGRGWRPFRMYKFRTMVSDAQHTGTLITIGHDARITRVGRLLRKTKIDELPQLLNIVKGEMSLVGPRPEVRRYVELFRQDYEEILRLSPGLTDFASLKYRNEAELLGQAVNPEEAYVHHILPEKIVLAKQYIQQSSLKVDLQIILKTLWSISQR